MTGWNRWDISIYPLISQQPAGTPSLDLIPYFILTINKNVNEKVDCAFYTFCNVFYGV